MTRNEFIKRWNELEENMYDNYNWYTCNAIMRYLGKNTWKAYTHCLSSFENIDDIALSELYWNEDERFMQRIVMIELFYNIVLEYKLYLTF